MAVTATTAPSSPLRHEVLSGLPDGLRQDLLSAFSEIVRNFSEGRWEPAELNGGKLSEVVYCIARGIVDGSFPEQASKPPDMRAACLALEQVPTADAPRSVRVQIPRVLAALYEIRNNRNVGHVGGDVDPNHMDALCVLHMAKWVVAELVRILHGMPIEGAAAVVELLSERTTPMVWQVGGRRRVLRTDLSMRDKTLLLLYAVPNPVTAADLVAWVEHSNPSLYRRDVLKRAHRARLIEYEAKAGTVQISPLGSAYVEDRLLPGN